MTRISFSRYSFSLSREYAIHSVYFQNLDRKKLPVLRKAGVNFQLKALPYNSERIRTLSINNFTFIDSFGFMQASLAELTSNLAKSESAGGPSKFKDLDAMKLANTPHQRELLLRKGV